MARLDFGGDGTQAILDLTTGDLLRSGTGGVFYASLEATTPLVDITGDAQGTVHLDEATTNVRGILNRFYGPDGVTQIAVDFGAGRFLIDSNTGRRDGMGAAQVARDALAAAQGALTVDDLDQPGGPAMLDPTTGRLPYSRLPADIGTGGAGGGADLDMLVIGGKSPVNGVLDLRAGDIGAARATDLSAVAVSGKADDLTGTLPQAVLPPLTITDVTPVATQAAMLALTAQRGDVAVRTDLGTSFILRAEPASTLANWVEMPAVGKVASVAGRQGAVVLSKGDVGLSAVDNTADSAKPVSTPQKAALDAKAPLTDPKFTGVVRVNDVALPPNVVGADAPGKTLVFDSTVDPKTLTADEVAVLDSADVVLLPGTAPAVEQVLTVKTDRTVGLRALTSVGGSSGTASSVQTTARRILAGAAGQERTDVWGVHPNPATVTVTAGSTSSITGAVRIPLKRASASLIDTESDPHFSYPGVRPGTLPVYTGNTSFGYAAYLTGGSSQNRRDYWRLRSHFYGQVIEYAVHTTTTTLKYRVWVDGMPLTADLVSFTATAGASHILKVDFGADLGPHVIELEVNDPRLGGAWIGPTDSLTRYSTSQPLMVAFGDSHTATGNGVNTGNTWPTWFGRVMGVGVANMAIGGTGFLTTAGARFRDRVLSDVVSMKPDLVVFPGGYNDVTASTAAAVGTEAKAVYDLLVSNLPAAVIIPAGPFLTSHTIGTSLKAQDDAQRQAATDAGLPFISYVDPARLYDNPAIPAWTTGTAYGIGDVVKSSNNLWKATVAHTAAATFTADQPTKWRALSFITGTGKSSALAGNGNADVIISSDGIHKTPQGHRIDAFFLATEVTRILRQLAA